MTHPGGVAVDFYTWVQVYRALDVVPPEIQEMFDLSAHRRRTSELQAHADAKIKDIDGRIAQLRAMRAGLVDVIAADCDSLQNCSVGFGRPLPFTDIGGSPPI